MSDKSKDDKSNIYIKINKLYSKSGYMDKYGSDVWTAAIICLSFIIFINYYYFSNLLEVVKADWPNQRCNPLLLPFAGFINKPTNMSNLEFTTGNFNDCLNTILKDVVLVALQPIYFAVSIIQEAVNGLIEGFNKLREMTASLRQQIANIVEQIYVAMNNLVVTFIGFAIKVKDSMKKINGILTTSLYSLFGSYMALTSLFLNIIDMIILILVTIGILCLFFFLMCFWPLIGNFFLGTYITIAIIMFIIMIPAIWFEIMLLRIMDLSTPPPPGIPGCFAGSTPIDIFTTDRIIRNKKIKDIQVGDKLRNGSTVTGIIQFAADDQNIYKLRGIFVTGEHRVYHHKLKWIKVKYHPESVYVASYKEPFVYCLNTDQKTFMIGDTLFSDWDDIDEEVIEDLNKYCVAPGYLPTNFTLQDIHTHLDSGFCSDSFVILENELTVPISEVKVNDVLLSGDKVVGVVKVAAHDLSLYNYQFESKMIRGSQNIHVDDKNLGIINCMNRRLECEFIANHSEQYLYHFLTDTKFVVINNIRFNDYNSGIDKYLRQFNM